MAERTATEPTAPGEVKVRRALISVSDKRGVVDFAHGLAQLGVELISTGGTARALSEGGLDVRSVTDLTGFPEIMDGRVKTLHPKLYASLLARRDDRAHLQAADEQEVEWVDLVCVNLYPFEQTASTRGIAEGEVTEDIDIGGPTMIRAAAKNFPFSAVVVEPESYDAVLAELRESGGRLSLATRESLAAQAFAYTARYDTAIARWFAERDEQFPPLLVRAYEKVADLPYGENPHQRAAFYTQVGARMHVLSRVRQHGGKALSFNNLLDLNAARLLVSEFQAPACAIVKHNNPCGCALAQDGLEAYRKAFAADPMSAFGGIIALNQPVDGVLAEAITAQFVEVVFAPGYTDEALEVLSSKPNLRILQDEERRRLAVGEPDVKQVIGGVLVQDRDRDVEEWEGMQVATKRLPTEEERAQLLFAWRVCKHVRSNAIVLAQDLVTAGIGAGQMSRVDSVRLAVEKSTSESLAGAAMASDAFFPFTDGPQLAIDAGITAIIQPGGSRNDPAVVAAADAAGVAMVLTGRRHFRH
ncbi:MAG: bifunctional phosphoribosylaminoimidazolecarboxamide formyltransferase/IMP cyclohydrolase [Solirubrobacterales bacterium]